MMCLRYSPRSSCPFGPVGPTDLGEDLQRLPPLTLQGLTQHGLGLAVRVGVGGVECGNADIAAVVFLAAYAVPILHPDLPRWLLDLCRSLSWITWGLFVVDIVVRLVLADERVRYLVRHWYDVLALPLLRPLRLLRLIPLLSVLNVGPRSGSEIGSESMSPAAPPCWPSAPPWPYSMPSGRAWMPTSATSATRSGGRVTTMTTVGYGDHYPGHWCRTLGRFRADDWRHRPAGHGDRDHPGVVAGRDCRSRERAGRGSAGLRPATGGQDRPTRRGEPAQPRPSRRRSNPSRHLTSWFGRSNGRDRREVPGA
jgi:hypothetical protein